MSDERDMDRELLDAVRSAEAACAEYAHALTSLYGTSSVRGAESTSVVDLVFALSAIKREHQKVLAIVVDMGVT